MASVAKYQVYNRRQQGLAETTRLILEFAGAKYENVFAEDWEAEKASTPLQQLPVLRVSQENGEWEQISESHTIERYLSVSLGLLGSTALEATRLDMYHASWTDMMAMFMWKVWRAKDEEAKKAGAAEFWTEFPKFLRKHDDVLKKISAKGPFYAGASPSLPDIFAFTWLNRFITAWIPSPPDAITEARYPHIWALFKGVQDSKGIKEYFDSGRWTLA